MAKLVGRNTINLGASASSVDDAYVDYEVKYTRRIKATGQKIVQRANIIKYNGTTKVAIVDELWKIGIQPSAETSEFVDTFEVLPAQKDARVSINPAMQTMDYITSERYGKGLDPVEDLRLPKWQEAARSCDERSLVTILLSTGTPSVGDIYKYPATGNIKFQGKVRSVQGKYITFEEVIGKFTNKWQSWKAYEDKDLIYTDDKKIFQKSGAGVLSTKPTSGALINGAWGLTKVTGSGSTTLYPVSDGNPVRALNERGVTISGYSLYDSDGISYWKYIGWDSQDQRFVTRHQTNVTIDTSKPIFDNLNSLLEHFGGILRYSSGKYDLEVEESEGTVADTKSEPRHITEDDIVGTIKLTDEGMKGAFNSLTASYADPANKFEGRNISFFNSEYLKEDRNVPRKGSISIPGITNYYNARIVADKFLIKSRFGLKGSITLQPRGTLLLAGKVINLTYSRYGWDSKYFRISSLNHNPDTTVTVNIEEYDDKFYTISNISDPTPSGAGSKAIKTIIPPFNLKTTNVDTNNELVSAINLTWENGYNPGFNTLKTEIYASRSPHLYITVTNMASLTLTTATDHGLVVGQTVKYQGETIGTLERNKTYYVKAVPSPTTFRLSSSKNGASLSVTTSATPRTFMTASVIATVDTPTNSYTDTVYDDSGERVEKYYWLRHKIRD